MNRVLVASFSLLLFVGCSDESIENSDAVTIAESAAEAEESSEKENKSGLPSCGVIVVEDYGPKSVLTETTDRTLPIGGTCWTRYKGKTRGTVVRLVRSGIGGQSGRTYRLYEIGNLR